MKKQKKHPTIWTLKDLISQASRCSANIDGMWHPLRAIGPTWLSNRIKAAWLVFTGKADAVIWPAGQ